jgi:hypothetical protein
MISSHGLAFLGLRFGSFAGKTRPFIFHASKQEKASPFLPALGARVITNKSSMAAGLLS